MHMAAGMNAAMVALAILVVGCPTESPAPVDMTQDAPISDASSDVQGPDADTDEASSPDGSASGLYASDENYTDVVSQPYVDITYTDVLGATRSFNILVYMSPSAPKPLPVVVMSHGGSGGKTDPSKSMDKWAPLVARAGYAVVAVAHPGRDEAAMADLCEHVGVPLAELCVVKAHWDRPHDLRRVLTWLDEQPAPLADALDLTQVAHMGHSAGAGAGMMTGGATRNFKCAKPFGHEPPPQCDVADLVALEEPRFQALVAMSPQGPTWDGFMTESFPTLDVPTLFGTGQGDGDPGKPANRRQAFDLSATGDKFLVYLDDPAAQHTLFEAETTACEKQADVAHCKTMRTWLGATVVAFLDATIKGKPSAEAWLQTDAIEDVSGGTATLERR